MCTKTTIYAAGGLVAERIALATCNLQVYGQNMPKDLRRSDCPIHCALNLLGDRWTLVIVRDLLTTSRGTFTELLDSPEGIATNILTSRLVSLQAAGIVEQLPGDKRYLLTEKGLDLAPLLAELMLWSISHEPTVSAPVDIRLYQKNPQQFIEQVKAAARDRRVK